MAPALILVLSSAASGGSKGYGRRVRGQTYVSAQNEKPNTVLPASGVASTSPGAESGAGWFPRHKEQYISQLSACRCHGNTSTQPIAAKRRRYTWTCALIVLFVSLLVCWWIPSLHCVLPSHGARGYEGCLCSSSGFLDLQL
ncbi:hypothetical protein CBL_05278 [Carabus blaptoides fortunei]